MLLKTVKFSLVFKNNLIPADERKATKADGLEGTHGSELKNSLAKHGAIARWPLGLWVGPRKLVVFPAKQLTV